MAKQQDIQLQQHVLVGDTSVYFDSGVLVGHIKGLSAEEMFDRYDVYYSIDGRDPTEKSINKAIIDLLLLI